MKKLKYLGAHVSASGGVENAILNAYQMNATAFSFFTKNQRQWNSPPLEQSSIDTFKKLMKQYNYSPQHIIPHGSYLLNCGSPDPVIVEKSRMGLLNEVKRCELLGLSFYNFHPGSTTGKISIEESISLIAESINYVHANTNNVRILLENTCGQGFSIGSKFEELKEIVNQVKDHKRIGICLDTCHAFSAGYDISTKKGYNDIMNRFDQIIGLNYLFAFHLNDSKTPCNSKKDRHEKIGQGFIGIHTFQYLLNDERFYHLPMILETPCINKKNSLKEYKEQLDLLLSLIIDSK